MPITIERPAERKCALCHDHVIRRGFHLIGPEGYSQFLCAKHVGDKLNAALKSLDTARIER